MKEALGRQVCKEDLAAADCVPPEPFARYPKSSPQELRPAIDQILKDCALSEGRYAVDCSEFPCMFFVPPAEVDAQACDLTRQIAGRDVDDVADSADSEWEVMWLVHPDERSEQGDGRIQARWYERMRWMRPLIEADQTMDQGFVALNCEGRSAVTDAEEDDALCEALLDYWGCDAPDREEFAQRVAHAEAVAEEATRPGCTTLDLDLMRLDCSRSPCVLTFLENRPVEEQRTQPSLCLGSSMLPPELEAEVAVGHYLFFRPIWPEDPEEKANAIERWELEKAFRVAQASDAWRAEHAPEAARPMRR